MIKEQITKHVAISDTVFNSKISVTMLGYGLHTEQFLQIQSVALLSYDMTWLQILVMHLYTSINEWWGVDTLKRCAVSNKNKPSCTRVSTMLTQVASLLLAAVYLYFCLEVCLVHEFSCWQGHRSPLLCVA